MKLAYTGHPDAPRSTRTWKPAPGRTDGLGVDLGAHYGDLRAVAYGAYSRRCREAGVDVEDLIAKVAERVLRSNLGARPFDPTKANLIRYFHLLCASRLSVLAHGVHTARARHQHSREDEATHDGLEGLEVQFDCPDPARFVADHLETVAWEARCDDAVAEDFPLAEMFSWGEGLCPHDPSWSGWREQAVRWVVAETVTTNEASRWWGVAATEAARRLAWGREAWKNYLDRIGCV